MDLRIDSPRSSFRLCVLILKILEDLSFQSKISFVPSFQMFTPFEQISLHFHKISTLSLSLSSLSTRSSVSNIFFFADVKDCILFWRFLDDVSPSFSLFSTLSLFFYDDLMILLIHFVSHTLSRYSSFIHLFIITIITIVVVVALSSHIVRTISFETRFNRKSENLSA